MSGFTTSAVLAATGVAAQDGATRLPVPAVSSAARATLPFTGLAVGVYLIVAFTLITVGFILRRLGGAPRTDR